MCRPAARPGTERADREQGGHPQGAAGDDEHAHEQVPPPDLGLLGAEVVEEGLDLLGIGRHPAPVLDGHVVGHEAAGPRHEAEPDPAEGDGQQDAFGLGLAAEGVDHGEADGGGRTGAEGDDRGGGRGEAHGRLAVGRLGGGIAHDGPPGGDPSGGEDDAAEGEEDGDEAFRHRTDAAQAQSAPARRLSQLLDVPGDVVQVLGGERVRPEHGHLAGTGAHGLAHLDRPDVADAGGLAAVAQRPTDAAGVVTGRAVGPVELAAVGQVAPGRVHVGDAGSVAQGSDIGDQRLDLVVAVRGVLPRLLALDVGGGHAPGPELEVGRRLPCVGDAGTVAAALAGQPVAARAARGEELPAGRDQLGVVGQCGLVAGRLGGGVQAAQPAQRHDHHHAEHRPPHWIR